MTFDLYPIARPFVFNIDPERAHELTLSVLEVGQNTPLQWLWSQPVVSDPIVLAGLQLPNRVGLAAGLDKNGRCIDALGAMGFGFIEVGTVTPKAQPGNPRPRMFRLPGAHALINRLGFNNEGLESFLSNIRRAHSYRARGGILGLNIGKNANTPIESAVDDYVTALTGVYPHADYVTVNISSPNTKDLRTLQSDSALDGLLQAISDTRTRLEDQHTKRTPIFVKIAPDLDHTQITSIADLLHRHAIDGVIATNTTLARDQVAYLRHGNETGGLSGRPVLEASNQVIRALRRELGTNYPIVGVGGVMDAQSAASKLQAGADVIQIYTGLIYQGPALVHTCAQHLRQHFITSKH
jgi:dihydroorotate dehydrogenase